MRRINLFRTILFNPQLRLSELLKLKKNLENKFLNNSKFISYGNWRYRFKGVLISRSISFIFKANVVELINVVEKRLRNNFSNLKNKGESFTIYNLTEVYNNDWPDFFTKLIHFNEKLNQAEAILIVQGSYADNTFISYSDIDLVIIGRLTEEVANLKKEIETYLIQIDPLQHHGVFFINKNSFSNYWMMDLPFATLKKALVMSEEGNLKIEVDTYFSEKYTPYDWIIQFFERYKTFSISPEMGVYSAKLVISETLLIPVLMLATKGIYVYKRDSFTIAKDYYSYNAWKYIEVTSALRTNWNQEMISEKYILERKKLTGENVQEFNYLSEIVDLKDFNFEEYERCFHLFRLETLNNLKCS